MKIKTELFLNVINPYLFTIQKENVKGLTRTLCMKKILFWIWYKKSILESSSKKHYIYKKSKSREISAHKGQKNNKTGMILSWESLHKFGNTWNTRYPCLWTQFTCIHKCRWKLYHEKNPYASIIQKHCHPLCGKAQLNWTEAKWKTALWSDELNSEILFGKHG